MGVGFLPPPFRSPESNAGGQTWQQAPLLASHPASPVLSIDPSEQGPLGVTQFDCTLYAALPVLGGLGNDHPNKTMELSCWNWS